MNGLPAFCSELMWWIGYVDCDPLFHYPEQKCIDAVDSWITTLLGFKRREGLRSVVYGEGVIFDDGILKVTALRNKHSEVSHSFRV